MNLCEIQLKQSARTLWMMMGGGGNPRFSGCFSALGGCIRSAAGGAAATVGLHTANSQMLFEFGRVPKCTMGQPDVLPADMVRLTASLAPGTLAPGAHALGTGAEAGRYNNLREKARERENEWMNG